MDLHFRMKSIALVGFGADLRHDLDDTCPQESQSERHRLACNEAPADALKHQVHG
jgi:hypothetical protein